MAYTTTPLYNNSKTPIFVDGTPAVNVPYKYTATEISNIKKYLKDGVMLEQTYGDKFVAYKQIYGPNASGMLAFQDLSTTSRASQAASGHHDRARQTGYCEEDPEASWITSPYKYGTCSPTRLNFYG